LFACSSKKVEPEPDPPVTYSGEFETYRPSLFQYRIDTVYLTLVGQSYVLFHTTNQTKICESAGDYSLTGGGLNFITAQHGGSNCDSLRIPKGVFSVSQMGDSLFLERHADSASLDIIYWFRLSTN
jgi:hypothetical protein